MEKFNTDLTQVLKWMHNKAPNIQALVNQKYDWYRRYNDQFWSDWYDNVFNLDTVDEFGVYVWCEILGVPKNKFVLEPLENNWAYGQYRKNYIASAGNTDPDRETEGGNFFGAGRDIVTNLDEARWALKLRYVTLTSDGRIENINRMLAYIFNDGQPYDFASDKFFYVVDNSQNITDDDLDLKFQVTDWRGTWQPIATTRTQLGYRNTDPYNIQQYTAARMSWTGTSPASQKSAGYFGGDPTGPKAAPDGSNNAVALTYKTPTVFGNGNGALTVQSILPNANSRTVFSVYLNFSNMPSDLTYYEIKCGDFGATTVGGQLTPAQVARYGRVRFETLNGQIQNFRMVTFVDEQGNAYQMDTTLAGFQDLGNGWYRVWNGMTMQSTYPAGVSAQQRWTVGPESEGSFSGQIPVDQGYYLLAFGHMVDYYQNLNQRTDNPNVSPFWYNNRALTGTTLPATQTDLVVNTTPAPASVQVAATFGPHTSMLYPGAVFTYTGRYNYWTQPTPVQIAVGDGTTRDYTIPQPPGYIPPYTAPMSMEYRIGKDFTFSSQFLALISDRDNGILPANAGIPYNVVKYT